MTSSVFIYEDELQKYYLVPLRSCYIVVNVFLNYKSSSYMVEAAGIEPATMIVDDFIKYYLRP